MDRKLKEREKENNKYMFHSYLCIYVCYLVFYFQTETGIQEDILLAADLVDNEFDIREQHWGELLSYIQVIQNEMHIETDFSKH